MESHRPASREARLHHQWEHEQEQEPIRRMSSSRRNSERISRASSDYPRAHHHYSSSYSPTDRRGSSSATTSGSRSTTTSRRQSQRQGSPPYRGQTRMHDEYDDRPRRTASSSRWRHYDTEELGLDDSSHAPHREARSTRSREQRQQQQQQQQHYYNHGYPPRQRRLTPSPPRDYRYGIQLREWEAVHQVAPHPSSPEEDDDHASVVPAVDDLMYNNQLHPVPFPPDNSNTHYPEEYHRRDSSFRPLHHYPRHSPGRRGIRESSSSAASYQPARATMSRSNHLYQHQQNWSHHESIRSASTHTSTRTATIDNTSFNRRDISHPPPELIITPSPEFIIPPPAAEEQDDNNSNSEVNRLRSLLLDGSVASGIDEDMLRRIVAEEVQLQRRREQEEQDRKAAEEIQRRLEEEDRMAAQKEQERTQRHPEDESSRTDYLRAEQEQLDKWRAAADRRRMLDQQNDSSSLRNSPSSSYQSPDDFHQRFSSLSVSSPTPSSSKEDHVLPPGHYPDDRNSQKFQQHTEQPYPYQNSSSSSSEYSDKKKPLKSSGLDYDIYQRRKMAADLMKAARAEEEENMRIIMAANNNQGSSHARNHTATNIVSGAHSEKPSLVMVEIQPGFSLPLRGSEETMQAIGFGMVVPTTCMSCCANLMVMEDCTFVICAQCRVISPVDGAVDWTTPGGSVGLGLLKRVYDNR